MKVSIKRDKKRDNFELDFKGQTLLEVLVEIKQTQDKSLTFSSGCKSGVCGSCAVIVNGKETLACGCKVDDGDMVEPLKNVEVIRDLVVDMSYAYEFNKKAKAWQTSLSQDVELTMQDEKLNELQSDCILCGSCYSACPVYAVNSSFLGPFSLTRVWRYVSDKRESNKKDKIDNIQINGIWDCSLCNECTLVCPQNISSKADIEKLRAKSSMVGCPDPNMSNFGGGFGFDGSPSF